MSDKGGKMYDITKLSEEQLRVLALYILPRNYPAIDMYEEMSKDLSIMTNKQLQGTIGFLRGQFFDRVFRRSPYWYIIDNHFRKQGECPVCKLQKQLIIYGPSYDHLGVNHLHPEDHFLACGDCHHMLYTMWKDTRLWRSLRADQEMQVNEFLAKLREYAGGKVA